MMHSLTKWARFVFNRHLVDSSEIMYLANMSERIGNALLLPFRFPLKTLMKFFTWQTVFLIVTVGLLVGSTIFYYPDYIAKLIEWIIPDIRSEQIKFFLFLILQIYLNGLLIRTLGRLSNDNLKKLLL